MWSLKDVCIYQISTVKQVSVKLNYEKCRNQYFVALWLLQYIHGVKTGVIIDFLH